MDERERWREGWMRGRSGVGRGRRVGCTVSRTWVDEGVYCIEDVGRDNGWDVGC